VSALLALVPWYWRWAMLAAFAAATFGYGYVMGERQAEHELDDYRDQVEKQSAVSEALRAARVAHEGLLKEEADEENRMERDRLRRTIEQLRARRPSTVFLPAPGASAGDPDLACFDRPLVERAYGTLVRGLRELADEGSAATVDLDTAKRWAQSP
jgi:hypothetical protein